MHVPDGGPPIIYALQADSRFWNLGFSDDQSVALDMDLNRNHNLNYNVGEATLGANVTRKARGYCEVHMFNYDVYDTRATSQTQSVQSSLKRRRLRVCYAGWTQAIGVRQHIYV